MMTPRGGQGSSGAVETATVKPLSLPALLLLEELMDVIGGHNLSQENPVVTRHQVLPTLKTSETCSPRMPFSGIMSQQVMAVAG